MKKSNTKNQLGLFGLLIISLSMSQGWAGGEAGSRTMASTAVADSFTERHAITARSTENGKTYTDDVEVTVTTRTEEKTTVVGIVDGKIITETKDVNVTVATFCSSLNCGDVKEWDNIESLEDLASKIKQHAADLIVAQNISQEELQAKRGDVEKRQEEADQCKREIVDINDQSKDKKLSRNKNKKKWFECRIAKFDEEDHDDTLDEFREEFGEDLEKLALSNDKDAQDILELLMDSASNSRVENYLEGLEDANSKYQRALKHAEQGDYRYAFQLNNELVSGSFAYERRVRRGSWGPFYAGSAYLRPRNRSYTQAFADIRQDMIERMNIAINGDVDSLVSDGLMTDMNRSCESTGRGCRVRTSYRSMPRTSFDDGLNFRGNGRGEYYRDRRTSGGDFRRLENGNYTNGNQYVPRYLANNRNQQYRR